jgi:TP901 family phage tail tape measure protein/lambda family phage tail tape measure protein
MFTQLEYQLQFVVSLSDNTVQSFAEITSAVTNMSAALGVGPVKAAEGMRVLAQTGLDVKQALAVLPEVMRLATVGELSMDDASRALVGTMNAFGQTIGDVGHIADVMAKAGAISQTSVQAMTESFRTASTVADEFGLSVEEAGVGLVLLAKRNIVGQAAGTSLMNMMTTLTAPTKHATQLMQKLGFSAYDSAGQIKPLLQIVGELRTKLSDYDKETQVGIMRAITNNRGWKELSAMINESDTELNRLLGTLQGANGFTLKVFNELLESTSGQFNLLKAQMEATFAEAGGAGQEQMIQAMRTLREVLADPAVQKGLADLVAGTANLAVQGASFIATTVQEAEAIGELAGKAGNAFDRMIELAPAMRALPFVNMIVNMREANRQQQIHNTLVDQQTQKFIAGAANSAEYIKRLQDETAQLKIKTDAIYAGVTAQDMADSVASSKRRSSRQQMLDDIEKERKAIETAGPGSGRERTTAAKDQEDLKALNARRDALVQQDKDETKAETLYAAHRAANAAATKAKAQAERAALEGSGGLKQGTKHIDVHALNGGAEADRLAKSQATDALAEFRNAEKLAKEQERHALQLLQIKRDAREISNKDFLAQSEAVRLQKNAAVDEAAAAAQKRVDALKGEKASTQQQLDTAKKAIVEERAFQAVTSANKVKEDSAKLDAEISKELEKQRDLRGKMLIGDQFNLRTAVARLSAQQKSAVEQAGEEASLQVQQRYLSEIERLEYRILELQKDGQDIDPEKVRGLQEELRLLRQQRDIRAGVARIQAEGEVRYRRSAGFGISEALRKYEDEATNTAAQIERVMTGAFKGMEDALVNFVMTGKFEFKDFARSVIADMARMSVQASMNPILKGVIGMATTLLTKAFTPGAPVSDIILPIPKMHTGGIVGDSRAMSYFPTSVFADAPRFHGGGIAGNEVPIIAQKGEGVFTQGQMKAMGGSNVVVNVTVNSDGTSKTDAQAGFADSLARNVKSVVLQTIAEEKRSGGSLAGVR